MSLFKHRSGRVFVQGSRCLGSARYIVAGLLVTLCRAERCDAELITFETLPAGLHLSDQLRSAGVLFGTVTYSPGAPNSFTPAYPYVEVVDDFVPDGLRAVMAPPRPEQSDMLITFVVPGTNTAAFTDHVGISLDDASGGDFGDDLISLRAFDIAGNQLAIMTVHDSYPGAFEVTAPNIHYAIIDFQRFSADAGEHYDDLTFGAPAEVPGGLSPITAYSAVPEPSSFALVASLAGCACWRRRRKR